MIMDSLKNKNITFWLKWSIGIILFFTISIFAYFNMSGIFNGVKVSASISPSANTSVSQIEGKAKNASVLTLNGREIKIDKSGNFHENLALPRGYSLITIEAQDAVGRKNKKIIPVYSKDSTSFALANSGSSITN